jgi:hypothetical protein
MTRPQDAQGLAPALQLVRTLLEHELIDELHLVTVGDGVAILVYRRSDNGESDA